MERGEPGEVGRGQLIKGPSNPVEEAWTLAWYEGELLQSSEQGGT